MLEPLIITDRIVIPPAELEWKAVCASGPGGQNVNKVATKIELRFDLPANTSLFPDTKARLLALPGVRVDEDGRLLLVSQETRNQKRNLELALERLAALVRQALIVPKKRRPTRPSRGATERRLTTKKLHSARKAIRRSSSQD